MTSRELSKHLQLSVTNLGPIAKADIELRPMTVFVGPSNTGKSYLAILIYALHRFFSGRALRTRHGPFLWGRTIFDAGSASQETDAISLDELEFTMAWLSEALQNGGKGRVQEAIDAMLPESAAKLIRPLLDAIGDYGRDLDAEIARCFGMEDTASLVRNRIAKGSRLDVSRPVAGANGAPVSVGYNLTISRNLRKLSSHVPAGVPLRLQEAGELGERVLQELTWALGVAGDDRRRAIGTRFLLSGLSEVVGSWIVSPLSCEAHYLPADRTGIMHAHRIVVQSLIGQAAALGSSGILSSPVYPVCWRTSLNNSSVWKNQRSRARGGTENHSRSRLRGRFSRARYARPGRRWGIQSSFIAPKAGNMTWG